jgi:hypothetical protein
MTFKDLKGFVQALDEDGGHDDDDICIMTDDWSMGPSSVTGTQYIFVGFDWDKGKILIKPSEEVHKKSKEAGTYEDRKDRKAVEGIL